MNTLILSGKTSTHIEGNLHKEVIPHFSNLIKLAELEGFDLQIVSGFRNYERQNVIWEEKLSGKRSVYNYDGTATLDIKNLNDKEKVNAILRWSAFPGTSRHHWGTDFDIFDAKALPKEKLNLIPSEYLDDGPMLPLTLWLDQMISDKKIPFIKPYATDKGGVAIEPWHLSYAPLATQFLNNFTIDFYKEIINESTLEIKDIILQNIDSYYKKYFLNF